MFSYEERIRAVELLIQYDMSYSTTIRELGYPSQRALRNWYSEYSLNGDLHKGIITEAKYTEDDKRRAVDYYLKHGKCVSRTVKKLGYPSRPTLDKWISQLAPGEKKHCRQGGITIKYSHEQKKQAVISLCLRNGPAKKMADEHGASRESLYRWKKQLLKEEHACFMAKEKTIRPGKVSEDKSEVIKLSAEKEDLLSKVDQLKKEIHRLKIERDIYEKAAELIKKDQGVSIQTLTNCEKAIIINALRGSHQLKELLKIIKMAKSSYHYQVLALKTDKYAELRAMIKKIFEDSHERYGYRRIHFLIKSMGTRVSEKVVRRIMKEEKLSVIYNKRRRYSSYKGEISPEVENKLNRDFQADKPNIKWLTDITELSIPAGKVYLSPIIDCFDGLPVS